MILREQPSWFRCSVSVAKCGVSVMAILTLLLSPALLMADDSSLLSDLNRICTQVSSVSYVEDLEPLETEVRSANARVPALNQEITRQEKMLKKARQDAKRAKETFDTMKRRGKTKEQSCSYLNRELAKEEKTIEESYEKTLKPYEDMADDIRAEQSSKRQKIRDYMRQVDELSKTGGNHTKIQKLQTEIQELQQEIYDLVDDLGALKSGGWMTQMIEKNVLLRMTEKEYERKRDNCYVEWEKAAKYVQQSEKHVKNVERKLSTAKTTRSSLARSMNRAQNCIDDRRHELKEEALRRGQEIQRQLIKREQKRTEEVEARLPQQPEEETPVPRIPGQVGDPGAGSGAVGTSVPQ